MTMQTLFDSVEDLFEPLSGTQRCPSYFSAKATSNTALLGIRDTRPRSARIHQLLRLHLMDVGVAMLDALEEEGLPLPLQQVLPDSFPNELVQ